MRMTRRPETVTGSRPQKAAGRRREIVSTVGCRMTVSLLLLMTGALAGFAWAVRMDEEERRRVRKFFFELRELPRRVLI